MKKSTFPALVLFAGALVFLSGCQTVADPEASSQPISGVSAQESQASSSSAQNEPRSVRENTTQTENAFYNDLLYREYSLGKRVKAGTATITKADILSACDSPSQIVIFRNNEIWKPWIIREKILRWTFLKTGTTAIWSLMKIKPFGISQSW